MNVSTQRGSHVSHVVVSSRTIDLCAGGMAYIGGMNFHSAAHPQPTDTIIDPTLFDFTDLIAHAQSARGGSYFD